MAKQIIIKHPNWWKLVEAKCKPEHLKMPPQPFEFSIDFPKEALEALDKDPLLQARIWEPAQAEWKRLIKNLTYPVGPVDDLIADALKDAGNQDPSKTKKEIESAKRTFAKSAAAIVAKGEKDMKKKVDAAWKKIQSENAELKKCRIKLGFSMTLRFGAILLTGLSIFASGGTNGVAWYALIRQLAGGAEKLRKEFSAAKTLVKEIETDLAALKKRTEKHPKLQKANVAVNAVTVAALGSDVTKNVHDVANKLKVLKHKWLKMQKNAHKLSGELNTLLKQVRDDKKSAPAPTKKAYDALLAEINKVIVKIASTQTTIKRIEDVETKGLKMVADLMKAQSANAIKGTIVVITVISGISRAVAMDLAADDSQIEACIDGLEKAGASVKKGVETFAQNLGDTLKAVA